MSRTRKLSDLYVGTCCVCGMLVMGLGGEPSTYPTALCSTHAREIEDDPQMRYIYCMTCRRATHRLVFGDEVARGLRRPVQYARSCPLCNDRFTRFDLIPEDELD